MTCACPRNLANHDDIESDLPRVTTFSPGFGTLSGSLSKALGLTAGATVRDSLAPTCRPRMAGRTSASISGFTGCTTIPTSFYSHADKLPLDYGTAAGQKRGDKHLNPIAVSSTTANAPMKAGY